MSCSWLTHVCMCVQPQGHVGEENPRILEEYCMYLIYNSGAINKGESDALIISI